MALIAFSWMPYARLINATVARLRQAEFVLASQSLGASAPRILFKHVLPNAISLVIVVLARDVGGMVMLEATFTFIGLGSGSEWGQLLVMNRDWIIGVRGNPLTYWWTYLPPTLALISFGIGWNLLGDGLNDALNPHRSEWSQYPIAQPSLRGSDPPSSAPLSGSIVIICPPPKPFAGITSCPKTVKPRSSMPFSIEMLLSKRHTTRGASIACCGFIPKSIALINTCVCPCG